SCRHGRRRRRHRPRHGDDQRLRQRVVMPLGSRRLRSDAGLSTIEVLVAVAVMGLALAPLIAVQSQISQTHARYQAAYLRATLHRNSLAMLKDLNPMAKPRGAIQLDPSRTLRWTSEAVTEVVRNADYPVGDGPYDVALYAVDAQVTDANAKELLKFRTE